MIQVFTKTIDVNGQQVIRTYAKLADLKRDPSNPKDIDDSRHKDLCDYLEKHGQLSPLLVDARPEKEGQLIGGNHGFEALKELGYEDAWIEFRTPSSDAEAFEIATLHNAQFSHYVESSLRKLTSQYQEELGDTLKKLTISIDETNLDALIHPPVKDPSKQKWEIVIRCTDPQDLSDKLAKISSLGIEAKAK